MTEPKPAPRSAAAAASDELCRTCGRPVGEDTRPFCSRRCRLLDLGAWFDGERGIAAGPGDDDEGEVPLDPDSFT